MDAFYSSLIKKITTSNLTPKIGKVIQFYGLVAESIGPDAFLGEICEIYPSLEKDPVLAEVVGFRDGRILLMPYGNIDGIQVGGRVIATGKFPCITIPENILGNIIDGLGNFMDPYISYDESLDISLPIYPPSLNPLSRGEIDTCFTTGVKSIDAFLTMGIGQRIGLFSGSGVGKSSLLGMIAQYSNADVNVIALIGERGREVLDFVRHSLGESGLKKSVIVVATADTHPLLRTRAAYVATAIAEHFRSQNKHVLLAMDSITRFAMAQREIGLAIGEPPTVKGYTPSAFSSLPFLIERAGKLASGGSITAIYTVLVEGDDLNDPIVDHARAILDGHIVLTRKLANSSFFPAIDILQSVSRLRNSVSSRSELDVIEKLQRLYSKYMSSKDMIEMGVYKSGSSNEVDTAIKVFDQLSEFLRQNIGEYFTREQSMGLLASMANEL